MNPNAERERLEQIKGRYSIIVAIISAIAAILAAVISAKYAPVEFNKNLDNYVSNAQEEIISQQTADTQKTLDSLNKRISELQNDNETQLQQISTLEQEKKDLLDTIAEKDHLIETLQSSTNVPNTPNETPKGTVKLTSLKLLGNNEDYYNHIYNSLENDDIAKSNLGESFNSSISMRRNGNIDFYLGSSYETLIFTICISEDTKNISDHSSTLTIYKVEGNGSDETLQTLYTSSALTMGFIPTEPPPINVSDVTHLRISFYADAPYNVVPRIVLGNPMLTPK